jgi:general L-amino acid transport system substrate-binding protein
MGGRNLLRCFSALVLFALLVAPVYAGGVLDQVRSRDLLRCGVSEGITGFSEQDADGRWRGMDVDFCRAVAAAVLGDPEKVRFVPLKASTRFPALKGNQVDLLARNTTWTLSREALLDVEFPGILMFDGQGFLVRAGAGVASVADLNGATVCVEKGTTHVQRLLDHAARHGFGVELLVIDSAAEAAAAFFAERCAAYTSDASVLAAVRAGVPGGAARYAILSERISREPLSPAVSREDREWITVVRWVLFVLILAEEQGATAANIAAMAASAQSAAWRLASGRDAAVAQALGVRPDWAIRAIQSVGNYGEMFERNLGSRSRLELERDLNRLWNQGGLHYAPPLR